MTTMHALELSQQKPSQRLRNWRLPIIQRHRPLRHSDVLNAMSRMGARRANRRPWRRSRGSRSNLTSTRLGDLPNPLQLDAQQLEAVSAVSSEAVNIGESRRAGVRTQRGIESGPHGIDVEPYPDRNQTVG
jgi:hypothetical protein